MDKGSCSFLANKTSCVSATIKTHAFAEISVGTPLAHAPTVQKHSKKATIPKPQKYFLYKSTTCHIQKYAGGD